MDKKEVRLSETRCIAEANALCNEQLHAQGRVASLQLVFYDKHWSFNTPFRMFSEKKPWILSPSIFS